MPNLGAGSARSLRGLAYFKVLRLMALSRTVFPKSSNPEEYFFLAAFLNPDGGHSSASKNSCHERREIHDLETSHRSSPLAVTLAMRWSSSIPISIFCLGRCSLKQLANISSAFLGASNPLYSSVRKTVPRQSIPEHPGLLPTKPQAISYAGDATNS